MTIPGATRVRASAGQAALLFVLAMLGSGCDRGDACAPGAEGCVARACVAGVERCPCRADGSCNAGLVCAAGTCSAASVATLEVSGDARSCEVLLEGPGAGEAVVSFRDGVRGVARSRGDRIALAFFADEDRALPTVAASVTLAGTRALRRGPTNCFDRRGAVAAASSVTLRVP